MFRNLKIREAKSGGDLSAAAALEELASQHDRMESARQAASECCDDARLRLVAAQHSGDPQLILAGHRELEAALKALRRSSVACDRTRRAFLGEKDLVEHTMVERPRAAGAGTGDRVEAEAGAGRPRF